jgi:hypothetical protein
MRTYVVQPGDSPAGIASRDDMAGCPKCARDLILSNPGKETVIYPNGFISFKELRVGEELCLPDKWFDHASFDLYPPAYFASLPYADGVTPSPFGDAADGILRDFRALDVAANKLRALTGMDDQAFANNVSDVAAAIDAAAQPAIGSSIVRAAQCAQTAQEAARWATASVVTKSRIDVHNVLTTALSNARYALKELYGTMQPPVHT